MNICELVPDVDLDAELPWFITDPEAALEAYMGKQYLVVDLETTNLDKGDPRNTKNRIVCASWRWAGREPEFRWGSELEQTDLIAAIEHAIASGVPIVAHAAKFELGWFRRMGFDLHDFLVYDTMLGDYVLRGNRKHIRLDLGTVARRWGYPTGKEATIDSLMKGGVCPSDMPKDLLRARVIKDVRQTDFVFRRQRARLHKRNQLPVLLTRCLATPWLADIEAQGLSLDSDRVNEEYERALREYAAAKEEFERFTGGVNHKSPAQMAKYLYGAGVNEDGTPYNGPTLKFKELKRKGKPIRGKKTKQFPEGQPKTDEKTLDKLKATTAKQKKFLAMRKRVGSLNAELTKTLQFFKGVIEEYDGTFFGVFNQHITRTHRLSSSGKRLHFAMFDGEKSVQFQNFPRRFKSLLKPLREGWVHWEVDGSQLEYRTAVFLGQDPNGMEAIRHDLDIHKYSAMALHNITDVTLVTKEQRQGAKPTTFRPLYGGTSGTPGQLRYFEWWKKFHADLEKEQESWTYTVLQDKMLITPWGLRFYWPYTRMSADGYIDNKTNIYNYAIQSLATAEIIPIAGVYMWHRMHAQKLEAVMNNTVHDSAIGEAPEHELPIIKQLGFWSFTMDVYTYLEKVYKLDFNVPLGAAVTFGKRWSTGDVGEWELNVERDGESWWKGDREDLSMYKVV